MNQERLDFLVELKAYGVENDIPNVSLSTAKMLHFLIGMKQAKDVLEIGCANGYSTIWLASAVEQFGGRVTTFDVSEPSFNQALENFKTAGVDHLIDAHFGDAKELLKDVKGKFDMIFIDARKKHYHIFWELAKGLIKDDGVIIVDDVLKFQHKTEEFNKVMEQETDYEQCVIPVDGDDGVMLVQKKK